MSSLLLEEILGEIKTEAKKVKNYIQKNNSPGLTTANDKRIVLKFLDDLIQHELANEGQLLRETIQLIKQYFLPETMLGASAVEIARYLWTKLNAAPQLRELIPHVTRGLITHRTVVTNIDQDEWMLLASLKATFGPKFARKRKVRISHEVLEARFRPLANDLVDYHEFLRNAGLTMIKDGNDELYLVLSPEVMAILRETDGHDDSTESRFWTFPLEIFDVFLYSSWLANAQELDRHFVNVICGLIALFVIFGLLNFHDVVSHQRGPVNTPSKSYVGYLMEKSFLFPLMVAIAKLVAFDVFGPKWVRKIYPLEKKSVDRLMNCYMIFRELCITVKQGIIQANHAILIEIVNNRVGISSNP